MLISVIIPVYNAEQYLSECIGSILSQSMKDFELLLIDDGSIDNSGAICDRFAAFDERIRVFHSQNGGVSRARNLGLDNARGQFVVFVDSDDWVEASHLQQFIDSGIGVDGVAFSNLFEERAGSMGKKGRITTFNMPDWHVAGGRTACMAVVAELLRGRCFGWTCNKMFARATIERLGLRFDERLRYAEDEIFTAQYCTHITHIVTNPRPTYHYRYVASSLLHGHKDPQILMQTRRRIFDEYQAAGYSDEILYLTARTQFSRLRRELRHAAWHSTIANQLTLGLFDSYQLYLKYARPEFRKSSYDTKVRFIGWLVCAPGSPLWAQVIIKGLHL